MAFSLIITLSHLVVEFSPAIITQYPDEKRQLNKAMRLLHGRKVRLVKQSVTYHFGFMGNVNDSSIFSLKNSLSSSAFTYFHWYKRAKESRVRGVYEPRF